MSACCGGSTPVSLSANPELVREGVRQRYAEAARSVATQSGSGCCSSDGCADPISSDLYSSDEGGSIPNLALQASLGCGNPTALAALQPGEVVLDLGSGGGIDVLLAAKRVSPGGKAYGLDMTEEMLALARQNQREAGVDNAEFLFGRIESVPLPADSVDVVMSNCVVNLSPEKDRVLAEAFRVLRPGGRLAIADIVFHHEPTPGVRSVMGLWGSCIGGALTTAMYRDLLMAAGFTDIDLEITREYDPASFAEELAQVPGAEPPALAAGFVRARKPAGAAPLA